MTGSEILQEAFGGKRKLWRLRGPLWPGVSLLRVALKRVSGPMQDGLTPSECLTFWGLEKNETTHELFYLAENCDRLFEGRIIVKNLARKWILSLCGSGSARKDAAGEELTRTDHTGEFQSVSLRYISVVENIPGNMCKNNEKEFYDRIVELLEEFLSSRAVPEGHRRLFHGTSTQSMNSILEYGIIPGCFERIGDFGPAFYCADKIVPAFRFALLTTLGRFTAIDDDDRPSASLIYFDVPEGDLDELHHIELEGEEWTEMTGKCITGKFETAYEDEERSALQLVSGKLVQNPHQVELEGATAKAFEDNRKQYAFRKDAGKLLLASRAKMGVALFDVYLPSEIDEGGGGHLVPRSCRVRPPK
jgi:hypothetical protein